MDDSPSILPTTEPCYACSTIVSTDDTFCAGCGYPLKGSDFDKNTFLANRENAHIDLAEFDKRLKNASNSLYYIAGVFVFYGLIYFFIKKDDTDVAAVVITNLVLAMVFLALGGYTRKKPLACIVSGLCLYVIVILLNAIVNPATIAYGIILKIIIIGYLIKGIKSAIEIEKIKKENNIA